MDINKNIKSEYNKKNPIHTMLKSKYKLYVFELLIIYLTLRLIRIYGSQPIPFSLIIISGGILASLTYITFTQKLVFYEDIIKLVKPFHYDEKFIKYEDIEKVSIEHVFADGMQIIIKLKSNSEKLRKIQWDYRIKKDDIILGKFKDKGVKVIVE